MISNNSSSVYLNNYIFSFKRYSVLRDLHSFPTRRSSDLTSVSPSQRPRESPTHSRTFADGCGRPSSGTIRAEWTISDRKSTRLNSSHVEISYAVFCLKKKIYKL